MVDLVVLDMPMDVMRRGAICRDAMLESFKISVAVSCIHEYLCMLIPVQMQELMSLHNQKSMDVDSTTKK